MAGRVRIGELLVNTGLISPEQLQEALEVQTSDSRRLGEILVAMKMIDETTVTQILSQQLSVPWVSLEFVDFSRQLLNLATTEIAEKHNLVPIYVRRSKRRQQTLFVAIEDPSNDDALKEVSEFSGLPVRPMIAPPSEIRGAIRAYYLGLPPEPVLTSIPPEIVEEVEEIPPEPLSTAALPAELHEAPPPPAPTVDIGSEVRARDSTMPQPSQASAEAPRMITLTMLDGTQMMFPAAAGRARVGRTTVPQEGALTARDLVEALRAEAGGNDLSEVLGENVNWQRMFAALLSLMMKKHLIQDWEFVRELRS